jgi:hypothetical protein
MTSGDARAMQNSQNIGADTNQPGFGKRTGPGKRPSQVAILSGRHVQFNYSQSGRETTDPSVPLLSFIRSKTERQVPSHGFALYLSLRFGKRPCKPCCAVHALSLCRRELRYPSKVLESSVIPPAGGLWTAGRRKRGGATASASASAAIETVAGGVCK